MTTETPKKFIPVAEPDLGALEEEFVLAALRSGWVSSIGEYIQRFQADFAAFCNTTDALAVSNGTVALHLAFKAAGIGAGDEVIIPSLTFAATAAAVCHAGATPVFVDCEDEIGTMDARAVEQAITSRTKAIVPVHLYGHPVDMDPLLSLAKRHHLLIIEDAAEAHGAHYRGQIVGSIGDMGTFSFYGNKILTTGEGGMITTSDQTLLPRLRLLRDHAMDAHRRYWHIDVGYNYRITNLQAALGVAQLQRYDELAAKRQKILETYRNALSDCQQVTFNPSCEWAKPAVWMICALLPPGTSAEVRDVVCQRLRQEGIDTRPYFIPLHHMPPYKEFRSVSADGGEPLPVGDALSARGFNLPSSAHLEIETVNFIAGTLKRTLAECLP